MDDWYYITLEDIHKYGGRGVIARFNNSPSKALQCIYPEHQWVLRKFGNTPRGFWGDKDLQRKFFNWLGAQLGYKTMDDWYNITLQGICKHGGYGLLSVYYGNSTLKALQGVYPEHNWVPWKFGYSPQGFWEKQENRKQFFDWLGIQLGYKDMNDWYNVTVDHFRKNGGGGLLTSYYSTSPSNALQVIYPSHNWMPWKFAQAPRGFWEKQENWRRFFDWLGTQLGYKDMNDWYTVTLDGICRNGGQALMQLYFNSSPAKALQAVYPEHHWIADKFVK